MVFFSNFRSGYFEASRGKRLSLTGMVALFLIFGGFSEPNQAISALVEDSDSSLVHNIKNQPLSPAFLASVPFLWTGKDSEGNLYPGNAVVKKPQQTISYHPFDTLTSTLLKGASYKQGDTVDIIASIRIIRFENAPANLVRRVGKAIVLDVGPKNIMRTQIISQYDVIQGQERVAASKEFSSFQISELKKPEESLKAGIVTRVENTPSAAVLQTLILDCGTDDGVKMGDIFTVYHQLNKNSTVFSSIGLIANVSSKSASLVLIQISDNHISDQDTAILFRRTN